MRGLVLLVGLALSACGSTQGLKPGPGQALPVAPYGAAQTPGVPALLTPSVQARPQRTGEVLQSSQERKSDPFDLPPR